MKNIHIIPTDKPSRLWMTKLGNLARCNDIQPIKEELGHNVNIYITNLEEIKDGWSYDRMMRTVNKIDNVYSSKIILTTDPDLIKDGVQSIDDEFLQWFVQNPSCEWVKTAKGKMKLNDDGQEYGFPDMSKYKIIISQEEPKQEDEIIDISDHDGIGNAVDNLNNEEPEKETIEIKDGNQLTHQFEEWNTLFELQSQCKNLGFSELQIHSVLSNKFQLKSRDKVEQETLEEAAKKLYPITGEYFDKEFYMVKRLAFIEGAKYQSERMYSEEEMRTAISIAYSKGLAKPNSGRLSDIPNIQNDIFQQFKKK